MNKAVYAGSFNPFTIGHFEILKEACEIFDVVYLCFAENSAKVINRDYGTTEEYIKYIDEYI